MHQKNIISAGLPPGKAHKALIMVHGRGGSARDILSLASELTVNTYALFAPEATHNSWYPQSFLAPPAKNEPWLSSALNVLAYLVSDLENKGISKENIYFLGFSQGACLTLEFVARNATRYGGVVVFTGGLIGDQLYPENYKGNFENTPFFIGTSEPDFHVPVQRVRDSSEQLRSMGANVVQEIYENMGHTISQEEIHAANTLIFK